MKFNNFKVIMFSVFLICTTSCSSSSSESKKSAVDVPTEVPVEIKGTYVSECKMMKVYDKQQEMYSGSGFTAAVVHFPTETTISGDSTLSVYGGADCDSIDYDNPYVDYVRSVVKTHLTNFPNIEQISVDIGSGHTYNLLYQPDGSSVRLFDTFCVNMTAAENCWSSVLNLSEFSTDKTTHSLLSNPKPKY